MTVPDRRRVFDVIGNSRKSLRSWQDRVRNPILTVLLVLELGSLDAPFSLARIGADDVDVQSSGGGTGGMDY